MTDMELAAFAQRIVQEGRHTYWVRCSQTDEVYQLAQAYLSLAMKTTVAAIANRMQGADKSIVPQDKTLAFDRQCMALASGLDLVRSQLEQHTILARKCGGVVHIARSEMPTILGILREVAEALDAFGIASEPDVTPEITGALDV